MSAAPAVTAATFEEEVMNSSVPVLIDFWAEWCTPCKALGPTIDQIAAEYEGKAKIFKLDVQSEAALAGKYGVQSIPTLLIFKGGQVVGRLVGLRPKPDITAELDKQL